MDRIIVLLSSYNGEKYIREQIESIIGQKDVDVHLLVRDDGSTDGTPDIIEEYTGRYPSVELIRGCNIGTIASFNALMQDGRCDGYEFLAFSDQDDVWMPEKLMTAVDFLKEDKSTAALYCSNLTVVDSEMNEIGLMRCGEPDMSLGTAIVENIATGCTDVFNQTARKLYLKGIDRSMEMHDYWMYLCCISLGKVKYDAQPRVLYRQHHNNQVGAGKKKAAVFLSNLMQTSENKRSKMLTDFADCYADNLRKEDLELLRKVTGYNASIIKRMRLAANSNIDCSSKKLLYAFKIRTLMGKM